MWDPLAEAVGDAELVFVAPDAFLGTLPLETLQREDGTYLLEHHAFVYGTVVDALVAEAREERRAPTAYSGDLLVVGDVDYERRADPTAAELDDVPASRLVARASEGLGADGSSAMHATLRGYGRAAWTALPGTAAESSVITELHEERAPEARRRVLDGAHATEEQVKQELPGHGVAHFATHGFFRSDASSLAGDARSTVGVLPGLLSGLVLSGANTAPDAGREDGLLTAEEISFLDLTGVDLVVLSACETALGQTAPGEGLLGLRRTFRQAGVARSSARSGAWTTSRRASSCSRSTDASGRKMRPSPGPARCAARDARAQPPEGRRRLARDVGRLRARRRVAVGTPAATFGCRQLGSSSRAAAMSSSNVRIVGCPDADRRLELANEPASICFLVVGGTSTPVFVPNQPDVFTVGMGQVIARASSMLVDTDAL